jgi:hypothetical protein
VGKGNGTRGTGRLASKVIERVQPRYEVQDVEFGKVYKWRPESVLIECRCGEIVALTASRTACERCDEEHAGHVRKALTKQRELADEDLHPWRYHSEGSTNDPPALWF